jgi:hypothetical protein
MLTIPGPILLKRASSPRIPECHVLIVIVLVNVIDNHTARVPETFIKIKWNSFTMFEQKVFAWQVPKVDSVEHVRKFCCFRQVGSILANHYRISPSHLYFCPCTHMPRTCLTIHLSIWIRLENRKRIEIVSGVHNKSHNRAFSTTLLTIISYRPMPPTFPDVLSC